jgi:hypothetical protein
MPKGLDKATSRTLVVVGNKEYRQMQDSARDLVRVLPNARGVIVSLGAKARLPEEHNWAMTAPDLFAHSLQAWIESAPLPKDLRDLENTHP